MGNTVGQDGQLAGVDRALLRPRAGPTEGDDSGAGRGPRTVSSRSHDRPRGVPPELELRHVSWGDRTAGLSDRSTDAAFVWLPLPQPPYRWVTIAREPRLVALPNDHRLAARGAVTMLPVSDLSPSELVLAWNERYPTPLLETFAAMCAQVASGDGAAAFDGGCPQ